MSNDEGWVFCGPEGSDVLGSQEITTTCGHQAWIAPSTQQMMEERPDFFQTICTNCLYGNPEYAHVYEAAMKQISVTKHQRAELAELFGSEEAVDRFYEQIGAKVIEDED